jgi:hypothetical protein
MVISEHADDAGKQLTLNDESIARVENFKYLGANMISSAYDLTSRKGLARSAFWSLKDIWRAEHIQLHLKIGIYKTAVLSILLYGCETWTMTKQMDIEINGFHTNCLRIILGIKRIDKVANDKIFSKSSSQPLTHIIRQ